MMGEIYHAAERAIVWLDDREITPFEFTQAILLLQMIHFESTNPSNALYPNFNQNPGQLSHWQSLNRLMSHPYWRRVWIVQEIALAKEVHILFAHKYIAWGHLSGMIVCLFKHPASMMVASAHRYHKFKESKIVEGSTQIGFIEALRQSTGDEVEQSLAGCIARTTNCAATDPRDLVYAVYNLVKWPGDSNIQSVIPIDYQLEVGDVYANVARYLVAEEPRFVLLFAGVGWPRQTYKLSSWVPDFASLPSRCLFDFSLDAKFRYRAGGTSAISIHVRDGLNGPQLTLTTRIILISGITQITSTSMKPPGMVMGMAAEEVLNRWEPIRRFFKDAWMLADKLPWRYTPSNQSNEEAFWRTLMEDRQIVAEAKLLEYKWPASPEFGDFFAEYRRTLFRGENYTKPASDELDEEKEARQAFGFNSTFSYGRAFSRACWGRKFAITKSGLMGLVPPEAEIDDVLCVIPGFELPVLLRRDSDSVDRYRFVGVCYIHGIMNGSVLENDPCILETIIY
jgi:hypothetical protein